MPHPPPFVRARALTAACAALLAFVAACGSGEGGGDACDPLVDPACGDAIDPADAGGDAVGADTTDAATDSAGDGTTSGADDAHDGGIEVTPDTITEEDLDGDGIPNNVEGDGDPDGDGLPNYQDPDSDGDGIPDRIETDADDDFDGVPSFLDDDSDGDGILDTDEGGGDPDGDGLPNSRDLDSDGDGISDAREGRGDSDGDGLPNMVDLDSDGDGIRDEYELGDDDDDGIFSFLDLDSDGDGWTDEQEYGAVPGSNAAPADTDGDRIPDFRDLDSDGDDLPDRLELGCPDSTDRLLADSDDDGFPDLLEAAFDDGDPEDENQACDPDRDTTDDVDFFFELEFGGPGDNDVLDFVVDVRRADIAFNMDSTGSMSGEIGQLQSSLTTVLIPTLSSEIDDSAYAFSQFDDFPCRGYGGGSDRPFILRQRVTTDVDAAVRGVQSLEVHGGSDQYESGYEAIYQACTGFGRDEPGCADGPEVAPFDPEDGYVEGVADGTIGGVGFRDGALPIVVQITDAPSHAKGDADDYEFGASRNEAFAAMRNIGAKLIGVASGEAARADLEEMALRAGSTIPACAWTDPDDGSRPDDCPPDQCCTGTGVRRPTDGECPLVYDIASGGEGLDTSIVAGVQALINFAAFDLTTVARDDEELYDPDNPNSIRTSQFIKSVTPIVGTAPDGGCTGDPVRADLNRDGVDDHFLGVVPGSQLTFRIEALNDFVPGGREPQVFTAYIDVVQQGGAVLDRQVVTILVPPELKPTN